MTGRRAVRLARLTKISDKRTDKGGDVVLKAALEKVPVQTAVVLVFADVTTAVVEAVAVLFVGGIFLIVAGVTVFVD